MKTLTHLIAVRELPVPEIREVTVPAEVEAAKLDQLTREFDIAFVYRRFRVKDLPDE